MCIGGKLTRDGKLLRLRLASDDISAGVFKGDLVLGSRFICFTSTKVQLLTQKTLLDILRKDGVGPPPRHALLVQKYRYCFPITKVQLQTQETQVDMLRKDGVDLLRVTPIY